MTTLRAFHGDPKVKRMFLKRLAKHRAADQLTKGFYWEGGKGCAVGCTIHSDDHGAYEQDLGIPSVLAHLEDRIFEGLPNDEAMEWPTRFLSAIAVGADLSHAIDHFMIWLLGDPEQGTIRFCNEAGKAATGTIVALYQCRLDGGEVTEGEWLAAADAALAAAYAADAAYAARAAVYAAYAAYAAAYAADAALAAADAAVYAAYAARAAAYAADVADVAYAAYVADAAYAAYVADAAAFHNMAEKLLVLLSEAPILVTTVEAY